MAERVSKGSRFQLPDVALPRGVPVRFSAGQLNDSSINHNPAIVQGAYHYGLGNTYTLYGGAQVAELSFGCDR